MSELREVCRQGLALLSVTWLVMSSGCAINPVTGTPEISFMSTEEEVAIGEKAARQIAEQIGFVKDEALTQYVERIGARVAAKSPRQDLQYRFHVLDVEVPNAFAIPGGYVYVSRGLLSLVNDESELANLLGHEVGHIAARHAASDSWRSATVGVLSGIGTIAGAIIGLGGLSQAAGQGFLAANSRDQENQADEVGQQLAASAGFRPLAMSDFLRALDRDTIIRENAVQQASFFDSHPVTTERIATTRARADALEIAKDAEPPLARDAFLEKLDGLVIGQNPSAGVFVDQTFLHRDLEFRVRFPEDWNTVNAPSFVGASDGAAQVELEYQGQGDDPKQAAREYFQQQSEKRGEARAKGEKVGPEFSQEKAGPRLISRRRTAYTVESLSPDGRLTVLMYWIPLPSGMYRITCRVATPLLGTYERDCRRTAASVRKLKRSDRDRIELVTLKLGRAEGEETLREFNERVGNVWSVELTAASNGLSLPYDLKDGQLLKYAVSTTYEPAPKSEAGPSSSGASDAGASNSEASDSEASDSDDAGEADADDDEDE